MTSRSSAALSWVSAGQFANVYADTNVLAALESEFSRATNPGRTSRSESRNGRRSGALCHAEAEKQPHGAQPSGLKSSGGQTELDHAEHGGTVLCADRPDHRLRGVGGLEPLDFVRA
jgi:hypothetical protein